jgi:chorismate dehydratase
VIRVSPPAAGPAVEAADPLPRPLTLASVSYLNAKPLLAGLDREAGLELRLGVPSELRDLLERGDADAALLPVFDLFDSPLPLRMLTAGGIGCDGPTLTVRLLSRVPIEQIRSVMLDPDSHTSVALLKVLLGWRGLSPRYMAWPVEQGKPGGERPLPDAEQADAVLLIGDKVVTAPREPGSFPHELDLGEAWQQATGLPFVFAAWTIRADSEDDARRLDTRLSEARERGVAHAGEIAEEHAAAHGWPVELARRYLAEILRYDIGPRQIEAIRRFGRACYENGLSAGDGEARLPR